MLARNSLFARLAALSLACSRSRLELTSSAVKWRGDRSLRGSGPGIAVLRSAGRIGGRAPSRKGIGPDDRDQCLPFALLAGGVKTHEGPRVNQTSSPRRRA